MKKYYTGAIMIILAGITACVFSGRNYGRVNECRGAVIMKVRIDEPRGKRVRLWLPYPVSGDYQTIDSLSYTANTENVKAYTDTKKGLSYLYADWNNERGPRTLELKFNVTARERSGSSMNCCAAHAVADTGIHPNSDYNLNLDAEIRSIAHQITGKETDAFRKVRAIYDWVTTNIRRNPAVEGCGTGDVERVLAEGGGKCVDISSVFIALSRASGIPAREVFGIRLPKNINKDITRDYHCWAEFYNPPAGWVAVDPADVRRIMLNENLEPDKVSAYGDYYFGSVDQFRVTLGCGGRNITLDPAQESGTLNYFMYPHAEVGGKALDHLDPESFNYSIDFKTL